MKNPGIPEVDGSDSEQLPHLEMDCSDMLSTKDVSFLGQEMYFVVLIFFPISVRVTAVWDFTSQKHAAAFGRFDPVVLTG